jgi:hypothetical protein
MQIPAGVTRQILVIRFGTPTTFNKLVERVKRQCSTRLTTLLPIRSQPTGSIQSS